jgi:hypothetical protein
MAAPLLLDIACLVAERKREHTLPVVTVGPVLATVAVVTVTFVTVAVALADILHLTIAIAETDISSTH